MVRLRAVLLLLLLLLLVVTAGVLLLLLLVLFVGFDSTCGWRGTAARHKEVHQPFEMRSVKQFMLLWLRSQTGAYSSSSKQQQCDSRHFGQIRTGLLMTCGCHHHRQVQG